MSSFAFFVLCIQACLIQNAFSHVVVDAVSRGSAGLSGYGLDSSANGLGIANVGFGGNAIGLGSANLGLGGASAFGYGSANGGLGNGFGAGQFNAGSVGSSLAFESGYSVPNVAAAATLPVAGPYGGTGYGELAVSGDVGAAGNAIVTGQIPVLGAVSFSGGIPASGVVSIAGNCPCGGVQL